MRFLAPIGINVGGLDPTDYGMSCRKSVRPHAVTRRGRTPRLDRWPRWAMTAAGGLAHSCALAVVAQNLLANSGHPGVVGVVGVVGVLRFVPS
jgi:hypothetical protein